MNILPARMGPTVCEELGPTVRCQGRIRCGDSMRRTSDTEQVESRDYCVLSLLFGI